MKTFIRKAVYECSDMLVTFGVAFVFFYALTRLLGL